MLVLTLIDSPCLCSKHHFDYRNKVFESNNYIINFGGFLCSYFLFGVFFNYFVFDSYIYIRFCFLACTDKTCISYWVNCCCLFLNNWLLMHFFLVHVALPPTLQRHVLHPSADRNFWPSLYTLPLYLQARVYIALLTYRSISV